MFPRPAIRAIAIACAAVAGPWFGGAFAQAPQPVPSAVDKPVAPSPSAHEPPLTVEAVSARLIAATVTVRVSVPPVRNESQYERTSQNPQNSRNAQSLQNPSDTRNAPAATTTASTAPAGTAPPSAAPARPAGTAGAGTNLSTTNAYNARNEGAEEDRGSVTVASGVSLGGGLIVGRLTVPPDARVRITLPRDGESLDAKVRVVDHYSGLVLFRTVRADLPKLEPAADVPAVGATLFSAAAAGIDEPLISQGILAGTPRSVGSVLPPLLPCDLRTTIASGGAGVVDGRARLIGLVAGGEATAERGGWTYVVPVRYLHRLLAHEPPASEERPAILERRRPDLGLTMFTTEAGAVEVERVRPGGPAALAGLREGDLVVETDGLKIRSVYQAVAVVLRKQPGDQVSFLIRRGERDFRLDLTLGSGGRIAPTVGQGIAQAQVGSYSQIRSVGPNTIELRGQAYLPQEDTTPPRADPARDEQALLREQLVRWSLALQQMREQLDRRDEAIAALQARVRQLEDQLKSPAVPVK